MKDKLHFGTVTDNLKHYIQTTSFSSIYILTDTNTTQACLPLIKEYLPADIIYLEIPSGEASKSITSCQYIWNILIEKAARNSLLIALGGGVITDIGGFCTSVFKRGIHFCAIPTTLMGMADAAIGSKNGIDFGGEKNLIGTFYEPDSIIIDQVFLQTLPPKQIMAGFAEMLKYGLIYDQHLWDELILPDIENMSDWVHRCIDIKLEIISRDPHDHDLRRILNFGHTIGHALESYSLKNDANPILHGEAVAAGMVLETMLSFNKGLIKNTDKEEIIQRLTTLFDIYKISSNAFPEILNLIRHDKKNSDGFLKFSLITGIGKCSYDVVCFEEEIIKVLSSFYLK